MTKAKKMNEKKIICTFLSFLQSVFLLAAFGIVIFYYSFLSDGSIIESLSKANFHDELYEHIVASAEDTLLPTGLPSSILEDAFSPSGVYSDVNSYINGAFSARLYSLDQDEMAQTLQSNIGSYLAEIGTSREEVGEETIDGIVQAVLSDYADNIKFPFILQIARLTQIFRSYMLEAVIACVILSVITGIMIYSLNRWKHKAFRYYAFSFGGCAFMLIAAPLVLKIWGIYRRLAISPEFMYNFVVTHIDRSILMFILSGVVLIALQIGFATISARMRSKRMRTPSRARTRSRVRAS